MTICKCLSASKACFLLFMLWYQTSAHGYEVQTHSMISEKAVPESINLTNSFSNLGLLSRNDLLTAASLSCSGATTQSVLNWIKEGSVCEDDTFTESFARYRNHFYDPQHGGKGYGGFLWKDSGILRGDPAPDWIIDKGPADGQLYSFSQGRQYFYNALTATNEADRKANLARMFRTLGNVMHIMQDMAQPQHTRNDSHGLPKSHFEVYTDQKRAAGTLPYSGEPVPSFATAREYFTNLAQFSNNNFVSAGTNFDVAADYGYNLPALGTAKDELVHTLTDISPEVLAECNASKPCVMTFYSTSQTVTNSHASALSILDQYLKLRQVSYTDPVTSNIYFKNRVFTLNKFTFDKAHPFLIPRATAYSAGILDYFFRGQIDMVSDPGNPGKYMIKNLGTENMVGDFALYYDAVDGNRYPVPGAAWSNLTVPANSQANNLSFASPDNPAPQTPSEFTLVFSGTMGAERAGYNSLGVANSSIGAVVVKKVILRTYATLVSGNTFSLNANTDFSTIYKTSGKWYWEISITALSGEAWPFIGIYTPSDHDHFVYADFYTSIPQKRTRYSSASYGASFDAGDVIGIAMNLDDGTITFYKNGVSQGVAFTTLLGTGSVWYAHISEENGGEFDSFNGVANFGASAFTYSVPSGYNSGLYE